MTPFELHHGDCLEVMRGMPDASVDAVVTDPPYGLTLVGSAWDREVPGVAYWTEALRVAKPGAHLLAFGGTRTVHRLMCAIEDAGWEVRDMIMWLYGTGFPKGNYPEVPGYESCATVLKPACEPIALCRKPLVGNLAANLKAHGTGVLNIGACRIGDSKPRHNHWKDTVDARGWINSIHKNTLNPNIGRYPTNVCFDGSYEAMAEIPGGHRGRASRYFYCAKPSSADKDNDLFPGGNPHLTIKPTPLMQWLVRLVTPPGGLVLDPFAGSGSTGKACMREGFRFVGIEREAEYVDVARARIERELEASAMLWSGSTPSP